MYVRALAAACLAVLLAAGPVASEPPAAEAPEKPTTEYLAPLEKHVAALEAIGKEIDRLQSDDEIDEREKEIKDVGRKFYREGQAFRGTIRKFLAGETRRGLPSEINTIREGVQKAHEMLIAFRRLMGAEIVELVKADATSLKGELLKWLEAEARARLAAKIEHAGLREIINDAAGLRDALNRAVELVKAEAKTALDSQTERLLGVSFHDKRSAGRAIKQKINLLIDGKIAKLVIRITRNEIVIELASQLIGGWVKEQLWNKVWPRIREQFRGRGKVAERTKRSVGTMRQAVIRLNQMPRDAKMDQVRRELQQAEQAIQASGFLQRDILREGNAEAALDLDNAINDLRDRMKFTRARFFMGFESLVMRLRTEEAVLADTLAELLALLAGKVEEPEAAKDKVFYLWPHEMPDDDGPVPAEKLPQWTRCHGSVHTNLMWIDLDYVQRSREALEQRGSEKAYLDTPEFVRVCNLGKPHREDIVYRVTCGGQTYYVHAVWSGGRHHHYGRAGVWGLGPGKHTATVAVGTRDNIRMDRKVAFEVTLDPNRVTVAKEQLAKLKETLENSRGRLGELSGLEKARAAQDHLSALSPAYITGSGNWDGAGQFTLMSILDEMTTTAEMLMDWPESKGSQKPGHRWVSHAVTIISWYASLGGSDAYSKAAALAGEVEGRAAGMEDKQKNFYIEMVQTNLASLAISSGNNVAAARGHLEKALAARKAREKSVDEKQIRDTWPEAWDAKLGEGKEKDEKKEEENEEEQKDGEGE